MTDGAVPAEPVPARDQPPSGIAGLSPLRRQLLSIELARRAAAKRQPIPLVKREPGVNWLPASPGQERLYFIRELDPDATAYLVPAALWLHGEVDVAALRASLSALIDRHETLRTGFEVIPGRGVVQVIAPPGAVTAELLIGEASRAEAMPLVERVTRQPFDLGRPPLLRAALWRVRDADPNRPLWLLALCLHHIVVDGWSLGALVDDLMATYPALAAGRQDPLPALPLQYADFVAWQRHQRAGLASDKHLSYWAGELAGVQPLDLAAARPLLPAGSLRGGTVPLRLPTEVIERLRYVGKQEKVTDFMVLLAVLAVTLHRWTGQPDFVVGGAVAGRSRQELDRLVGFFVNTLPVRVRLDGPESFRDVLRAVRQRCLAAYSHAEVPFEQIVQVAGSPRRRGRTSLVQVLLAMRDAPGGRLRLPGIEVEPVDLPSSGTDLDLVVSLAPDDAGQIAGWLAYSCDQFTAETAGQFAAALAAICVEAAADADQPVDRMLAGAQQTPSATGEAGPAALTVLDERDRPVPDGAPGEICADGLRTGNLGRRRPDGAIESIGRLDRRISLDGAVVDLDHVESVLRHHDAIADAAAIADEAASTHGIACYVVPDLAKPAPQAGSLARYLGLYLPHQAVALRFAWVTALPRTAAGQVDYARLPQCDAGMTPDVARPGDGPDPLREVLSGIWSRALGVDDIGAHDDFFAMGGHSLLATTIVAEVHDLFRCQIGLRLFMEAPTIAGLAQTLRQEGAQAGTDVDKVAELILQVGQMLDADVRARLHD